MDLNRQGGLPNLPQNNIYGVNNPLSEDHEHHLSIRLFKWDAEILTETLKWDRVSGVILFRVSVLGATKVVAVPYGMEDTEDMEGWGLLVVLHQTMKRMNMLDSVENLDWIAHALLLRELCLKFGLTHPLLKHYSDVVLVMIFDLKINQASHMKGFNEEPMDDLIKRVCSMRMPHISNFQINAEINLENVEEIEGCLKACPGMGVRSRKGMEEVESSAEIAVLNANEENDADCSICLGRMSVGYRYVTTCCGHKFHKICMSKWQIHRTKAISCPMCRNSLYF